MRIAHFGLVVVALAGSACDRHAERGFIVASGHVEATEVRLASKIAGRIETFSIDEGAVVKAGQEVARVDTTDLLLVRSQVSAERGQASAELRLREAGYRKEDKDELRAQGAALGAELDGAQRDLDRMQALLEKGSGTAKARDDAKARRDSLAARLAATNAAIARADSGFRDEEIDAARARLAAVEARLAQLDQQITDASVRSPLDAVVTDRLAEPGEWATSGAALAVLTDLARPWLTVYVSDPDLPRVRLGQKVEVVTDDGAMRAGTVTFIAPNAEFTPKNVQTREERAKLVYKVKIALDNADGIFKPGMPAEARLATEGAL
jgi:HlyD family secretion protein